MIEHALLLGDSLSNHNQAINERIEKLLENEIVKAIIDVEEKTE